MLPPRKTSRSLHFEKHFLTNSRICLNRLSLQSDLALILRTRLSHPARNHIPNQSPKEENSGVSALRFIKLGDGIYKLALADNEATSTDTLVAVNGTLTVKGLDEGTYWFEETKAPEGYSINVDGASATIKESKDKNVTVPTSLKDTKLSALPSTGGIGTTIFTIAGCLIMVAAAGLFFASRKRTNK